MAGSVVAGMAGLGVCHAWPSQYIWPGLPFGSGYQPAGGSSVDGVAVSGGGRSAGRGGGTGDRPGRNGATYSGCCSGGYHLRSDACHHSGPCDNSLIVASIQLTGRGQSVLSERVVIVCSHCLWLSGAVWVSGCRDGVGSSLRRSGWPIMEKVAADVLEDSWRIRATLGTVVGSQLRRQQFSRHSSVIDSGVMRAPHLAQQLDKAITPERCPVHISLPAPTGPTNDKSGDGFAPRKRNSHARWGQIR